MIIIEEIWRDIKGFENKYQISNYGRVKSLVRNKRLNNQIRKTTISNEGYEKIVLTNKKYTKTFYIHRLVAETFIPNPKKLKEVNHKDEIKTNNYVENLEWCTRKYNINYGKRNNKSSNTLKENNYNSKQIFQYDLNGKLIKKWKSVTEAANFLKINKSILSNICNKNMSFYNGFYWSFIQEDKKIIIAKINILNNKNNILKILNQKYKNINNKKHLNRDFLKINKQLDKSY